MSSKAEQEKLEMEILSGNFDLLLNDAEEHVSARPKTSNPRTKTSKNVYAVSNNDRKSATTRTLKTFDADDLLQDPELSFTLTRPSLPKIKEPTGPTEHKCQHIFQENRAGSGFFAQTKFCRLLKKEIQEKYSVETTITKGKDGTIQENPVYIIDFKSTDRIKTEQANESLTPLFGALAIKILDDSAGFWTKYSECNRIIQAYSDQNEYLHILCEYQTTGLWISYFNKDKSTVFPNLCISLADLDKIIQEKFKSLDILLPSTSDLTKDNKSYLAQDILKLEKEMKSKNILMILEQRRIRLFGLVDIINYVEKQIEDIKKKYASDTVKLIIEPKQIQYLLNICNDELKAIETNYQNTKVIEALGKGEFTGPSYLHDTIEQAIMKLAKLCTPIQFQIQEEAFRVIAHDQCSKLIEIARQHKCQIEIQEKTENLTCEIPKATAQDHVSDNLTAAAIKIHQDDLAEQKVDLVVVCSTSILLLNNILGKAGPSIQQEYNEAANLSPLEPFETNSGQLKCRKLLFLRWEIDKTSTQAFYRSIRNFVTKAVQHAIKAHHTSIAFPAIGCGLLNFQKDIIANEMLVEAQKQLLTANVLLQIIFAILPKQTDVYKVFQDKLESLQKGTTEIKNTQFSYKSTTLTITIISSYAEKQEECKKALNDHAKNSALFLELLKQDVLKKWTQPAINEFYRYCFNQHVIVDMNITIGYLKLFGLKESVIEAENNYLREQTKQSERARLAAIARDVIWAYKINDNTSEKYSLELNARIEDAHSSKVSSFNYTDNKSEEYTIDFKTMTEKCINKQTECQIIRHADFNLPEHWAVQSENVAQFKVQINSTEYQEIVALFNQTMATKYSEILYIDRIQNKQWYMQYNSYKSFSPNKDTERKLFHGCPHDSAQLIIHSFFNRSFAGINGTVYGQGAYFSANALYSHTYAKANTLNGERCMFVANVLVGKTIFGNTTMKTPPQGYDSTTDANHIFVTYRDDQAYAAYLIIYK